MKHQIFVLLLALSFSISAQERESVTEDRPGQRPPAEMPQNRRGGEPPRFSPNEFIKRQEAFIIREAKLTVAEAAYFFPLFHQLNQKQREINEQIRNLIRQGKNDNTNESKCAEILKAIEKKQTEKLRITQSYYQKYRKILSTKKILQAMDADNRFERRLMRQMFNGERR